MSRSGTSPFVLSFPAEYAAMGLIPGGMYKNRDFTGSRCIIEDSVKSEIADIIFDPQTSGGLLVAVPERDAEDLVDELRSNSVESASIIGSVKESVAQRIIIV